MEKKHGESSKDYVKRLFAEADKCIRNIEDTKEDMKKAGVIGFCSECGCNIYKYKEHKCN